MATALGANTSVGVLNHSTIRMPQGYLFAARIELWVERPKVGQRVRDALMAYMVLFGPPAGDNLVPRDPGLYWADRGPYLSVMRIFVSAIDTLPSAFDEIRSEFTAIIEQVRSLSDGHLSTGIRVRLSLLKAPGAEDALAPLGGGSAWDSFSFPTTGRIQINLHAVEKAILRWRPSTMAEVP